MKYALVEREYLPWNKTDEYYTRRKEIALSNSREELEKIIKLNNLRVGNDVGEYQIIER